MTATSLWFSNSDVAATDAVDPLTSSPMTRALDGGDWSATRTTLTSEPFLVRPSDSAALNVASPHGVGGCVLRMPKLGERENPWPTTGPVNDGSVDKVSKVVPTRGCHRRVRRERLLGAVSSEELTHPGLAGFPTSLTVHPDTGVGVARQPLLGSQGRSVGASGPLRPPYEGASDDR